jgi:plasmid stabilization system protein ParE
MTPEPLPIVFQRRASLEAETINAWWRTNRSSAPDLFVVELERVLQAVALLPELGAPARNTRLDGVRRILLAKTRHCVYYRRTTDTIQVLAIWHTSRRRGPGL